jgi:hypothetical protein
MWFRSTRKARRAPHPGRRTAFRPRVEGLEDRVVPATFVVTNGGSPDFFPPVFAGTGTLLQAILDANATPNDVDASGAVIPHRIEFAIPADDPSHVYYRNDGVSG